METDKARLKTTIWVLAGFGLAIFIVGRFMLVRSLPPQLPLWYSRPWGESQLANPNELWILPAITVGVAIITHTAIVKITKPEKFWLVIGWSGIFAMGFLILALIRIWTLSL